MNKEIPFDGFSTQPSDYNCQDGQLATSFNLINDGNGLQPLFQPEVKLRLPEGFYIIFIHKTSSFTHYLVTIRFKNLFWIDPSVTEAIENVLNVNKKDNPNHIYNFTSHIKHIDTVGNTIIVSTEDSINYLLWTDDAYNYLGDHLPEIPINFGLIGHPRLWKHTKDGEKKRGNFEISFDDIPKDDIYKEFTDANKTKITEAVMAKVNLFIREQTVDKGRFCFPFFVRYAYRLFDGSLTMQSAPVLMTPSTTAAPIVIFDRISGSDGKYNSAQMDIMLVAADLYYESKLNLEQSQALEKWKDVITSIDIFISKPIYTFDPNGLFIGFNKIAALNDCQFIGKLPDEVVNTFNKEPVEDRFLGAVGFKIKKNDGTTVSDCINPFLEYNYATLYSMFFDKQRRVPIQTLQMPELDKTNLDSAVEDSAIFYKLSSCPLRTFYSSLEFEYENVKSQIFLPGGKINIADNYLQSLTSRGVLPDDYLSHDKLIASSSFAYNARINLAGIKRKLFGGFNASCLFQRCDYTHSYDISDTVSIYDIDNMTITSHASSARILNIRTYIRENGKEYYVDAMANGITTRQFSFDFKSIAKHKDVGGNDYLITYNAAFRTEAEKANYGIKTIQVNPGTDSEHTTTETGRFRPTAWGNWMFYPNPNAYRMEIIDRDMGNMVVFATDLKTHPLLNGAYAFLGFSHERGVMEYLASRGGFNETQTLPTLNKVYTSEVNNPFYFPLTGINTVGTGEILGISTSAKALSQGQFGQFPLYAFSTEGVWALEVSSTGSYSAKQPITRDVCNNPLSITQLDDSVLFATSRGLIIIRGSETTCITDSIASEDPFQPTLLNGMTQLHAHLQHGEDNSCLQLKPFSQFLNACRIVYDYRHQHIIVYNPSKDLNTELPLYTYAYVFSLKSKKWGMQYSTLTSTLNSYPDALAMGKDYTLLNLSRDIPQLETSHGLLVTRPFKLDMPDILKSISDIIIRGQFRRYDVAIVLYGSRDLYSWHPIYSSKDHFLRGMRGTPYKYFRLAAITTLTQEKSISHASIIFEPRHTNNLR